MLLENFIQYIFVRKKQILPLEFISQCKNSSFIFCSFLLLTLMHLSLRHLSLLSFVNRCGSQRRLLRDDHWLGEDCRYLKCPCAHIHVIQITQSHADLEYPSMWIMLCEIVCIVLCVYAVYVCLCVLILQHADPLKGLNWVYQGQWDSRTDTHMQWPVSTDTELKPCAWKAIHVFVSYIWEWDLYLWLTLFPVTVRCKNNCLS